MAQGVTYSSKMRCGFNAWRVISDGEIALEMPDGQCCDMSGAIDIAEKIMPSVWRIQTISGGKTDVEYRLFRGKWDAYTTTKD